MTMRRMDTEEVTQRIAVNDPKQSLDVLGVCALEQRLIVDGGKIIVSIIGEKVSLRLECLELVVGVVPTWYGTIPHQPR